MTDLHVVLGNQLFPIEYIKKIKPKMIFMKEDLGLCTYEKHHKHKLILFLSAMRSYRDELQKLKLNVEYQEISFNTETYVTSLIKYCKNKNIQNLSMWEIEDKWFKNEIQEIKKHIKNVKELQSPMFLTQKDDFLNMCPSRTKPKFKMTDFYINQRKKLNILITAGKPTGGKWTYDGENRKKIPKNLEPPSLLMYKKTTHTNDVMKIIAKEFKDHYGDENNFNYPTTRKQALNNLECFIKDRFKKFGDYEDSVDQRSHLWFHSNLSSSLNIGLITPSEILRKVKNLRNIPINSYEGFIRQIIGWREFMRCIYHHESDDMEKKNFFKHKRKLRDSWYTGETGLEPLDMSIKSTIKHAYSHHIERLMIQINLMNLCEIAPKDAYKWFMELYIDSSDWVMTPNVYSMGLFADGGIMATKPYICGSNYILKMMDFKKGSWCDTFDGLYWRFIDKNRSFFKTNPRLNMMVGLFDKMKKDRKEKILLKANQFIKENTK
tara:strand:- start:9556 stop:11031 length:1476 start_codon:yes stop_codon:yes gene_type:complete